MIFIQNTKTKIIAAAILIAVLIIGVVISLSRPEQKNIARQEEPRVSEDVMDEYVSTIQSLDPNITANLTPEQAEEILTRMEDLRVPKAYLQKHQDLFFALTQVSQNGTDSEDVEIFYKELLTQVNADTL